MAKHVKHKDKKVEQSIFGNRIGFLSHAPHSRTQTEVTLGYNKGTGRYDLKLDGQLNLSASYQMCSHRAACKGVDWNKD